MKGRVVAGAVLLIAVAGCSQDATPPPQQLLSTTAHTGATATRSGSSGSATSSRSTPTRTGSRSASPPRRPSSPAGALPAKLPGSCTAVAQTSEVNRALGTSLAGDPGYVRDVPIARIGRLGRVTCNYGASKPKATPPVQIGVSLYKTAAQASSRVTATVQSATNSGATSAQVGIGIADATVLQGSTGVLVVLSEQRVTVAVSVDRSAKVSSPKKMAVVLTTDVLNNLG